MFLQILSLLLCPAASVPTTVAASFEATPVTPVPVQAAGPDAEHVTDPSEDDGRGTPYKVDKDDNICGLDEPRQLSKPALVDYQALIDVTPEQKTIQDKGIDPTSAKGIELMTKARRRVLTACETVRGNKGYCSVWKTIARRDGKKVPDATKAVKDEIKATK